MLLFEWDERKAKANLKKHKISFELATEVFYDPMLQSRLDQYIHGETRYSCIGSIATNNVTLFVVYVEKLSSNNQEAVRIISARKANKQERRFYEKAQRKRETSSN